MTVLPPTTLRESRILNDEQCLRCSKCREWKGLDQFSPNNFTRSGRQSHCKACVREYHVERRAKQAEKNAQKRAVLRSFSQNQSVGWKPKKTAQKGLKRKRAAIRPVSEKRKAQNKRYLKLRLEFLRDHQMCQAPNCQNFSTEVHHINSRSGEMLLDFTQCVALCGICHRMVHDNPLWAKEHGLYHTQLK